MVDGEVVEEAKGADPHTTNNKMELTALIAGLGMAPADVPVEIYTDSQLIVNIVNKWADGWEARGVDQEVVRAHRKPRLGQGGARPPQAKATGPDPVDQGPQWLSLERIRRRPGHVVSAPSALMPLVTAEYMRDWAKYTHGSPLYAELVEVGG